MIDLNNKKSPKKIYELFKWLDKQGHKDIKQIHNHGNFRHSGITYVFQRDGIYIKIHMDSYIGVNAWYNASIEIASSPASLLKLGTDSTQLLVWNSANGWLVNGPWEESLKELFKTLDKEEELISRERILGTEARQQLFRDAWSK